MSDWRVGCCLLATRVLPPSSSMSTKTFQIELVLVRNILKQIIYKKVFVRHEKTKGHWTNDNLQGTLSEVGFADVQEDASKGEERAAVDELDKKKHASADTAFGSRILARAPANTRDQHDCGLRY